MRASASTDPGASSDHLFGSRNQPRFMKASTRTANFYSQTCVLTAGTKIEGCGCSPQSLVSGRASLRPYASLREKVCGAGIIRRCRRPVRAIDGPSLCHSSYVRRVCGRAVRVPGRRQRGGDGPSAAIMEGTGGTDCSVAGVLSTRRVISWRLRQRLTLMIMNLMVRLGSPFWTMRWHRL